MLLVIEFLIIIVLCLILFVLFFEEKKTRTSSLHPVRLRGYWDGANRRTVERLDVSLEVSYYANGVRLNAKGLDISTRGIRLLLDEKLENGMMLRLEIKIPNQEKIIRGTGEIVWSKKSIEDEKKTDGSRRLFNTGIKFLKFNPEEEKRLFNFIRTLQSQAK